MAFNYDPSVPYHLDPEVQIGEMNVECEYCKALKWPGEPKGMCCNGGKDVLPLCCLNIRPF